MKTVQGEAIDREQIEELNRIVRLARNVLRLTLVTGLLGLLFLGAAVALSGCSTQNPQPDLNTYGALQPLCVFWCHQVFTLTEGDGAAGSLTASVSDAQTLGGS